MKLISLPNETSLLENDMNENTVPGQKKGWEGFSVFLITIPSSHLSAASNSRSKVECAGVSMQTYRHPLMKL